MFYAYVIKSSKFDFYYKGHCEDLDRRLLQHNSGMAVSIKQYTPFEIVYFEKLETREDAIRKEKYFKSAAGRRYLKNKLAR